MVVVVVGGNVLHHIKKGDCPGGEMSGECPREMSRGNIRMPIHVNLQC